MTVVLSIIAAGGWLAAVILSLLAMDLRQERNEWMRRSEYMRRTLKNADRHLRQRRGVDKEPWDDWAEEPTFVDPTPKC